MYNGLCNWVGGASLHSSSIGKKEVWAEGAARGGVGCLQAGPPLSQSACLIKDDSVHLRRGFQYISSSDQQAPGQQKAHAYICSMCIFKIDISLEEIHKRQLEMWLPTHPPPLIGNPVDS